MKRRRILVVGGVAGGATAAARARRTDEHAEIIMFEKGPYISFANCGLPFYVGREIGDRSALLLQTPETFRARFDVDVRVLHEVIAIDRAAKEVAVRNLRTGETYREPYDKLILAPGSVPVRPPIRGIDLPNVHTLRTVPDADAIRAQLDEARTRRAVVVGAGFIGLEMVEGLVSLGLEVALVEKAAQVLPPFDPEMAAFVRSNLEEMGVEVITGDGIAAFEGAARATGVRLESGRLVEGDLFVLGLGVRPDLRLAQEAGLAIGPAGGIRVNDRLETSDPDIYAAGDAAEKVNLVTGAPALIPLAGPANKQGRVAGANAAGDDLRFPGAIGTAIVRVGGVVAAVTGLSEREARAAGLRTYVSYTLSGDHADYYPGAQEMFIKLVAEEGSGRLLGAQLVGGSGVDKRADVFATAIMARMTVDDVANLDLAYAPPFGSAKDPAVVAGMVAQNIRRGTLAVITPAELLERMAGGDDLQIVDVRSPFEYEVMSVPGAVNIPVDEIRSRTHELDPNRETVVCDRTGATAYVAARELVQRGFRSVRSLTGGLTLFPVVQALAETPD